jgi:fumarylacetoacetate (FAA) hydrolase
MKLATLDNKTPDGELVVISRDLKWAVSARSVAPTLQDALERWSVVEGPLRMLSETLATEVHGARFAFDPRAARAPMPRAWQWLDGSAFKSHGDLMATVFGMQKLPYERPLMYQGLSHQFLSGHEDVPMMSEEDGIDFEGEYGVITDRVPMGTPATAAGRHIKLIVLVNDWSLRVLAPIEMKTGFGWIQAKPACSMAPVAITPDELGPHWKDGRVALPLHVDWNRSAFGRPNGAEMAFSFPDLVAHAARTRELCAGTIIGSGTVSNETYRETGSTCIAERRGIETLDYGKPRTDFMKFGDEVGMFVEADGTSLFGEIRQRVVRANYEAASHT